MRSIALFAAVLIGVYLLLTKVVVPEPPISVTVHDGVPTTIRELERKPVEAVLGHTFLVTATVDSTWRVGELTAIRLVDGSASLVAFTHGEAPNVGSVVTLLLHAQPSAQLGIWSGPAVFLVVEQRAK